LRTIANCFGLAYFLAILVRFSNFYFDVNNPIFSPEFFPVIGLTFFAYALSFFGFNQPSIFVNKRYELLQEIKLRRMANAEKAQKRETKYEKSGLKEVDAKKYLSMIEKYMEEKKPYLDGNFTIENMARDLDIQKYYLTQIINEKLNKNFYTFVNEFRVNEVKRMLLDKNTGNFTLLGIAYDCGFNSKSAFNSIFKKITNETPSQFKKRNLPS
jgi:AraC-like DNA-binding protein